jgi:hypothetical protein
MLHNFWPILYFCIIGGVAKERARERERERARAARALPFAGVATFSNLCAWKFWKLLSLCMSETVQEEQREDGTAKDRKHSPTQGYMARMC